MQHKSIFVLLVSTFLASAVLADTARTPAPKRLDITVTAAGFTPSKLTVARAQPVTLVFTRKTDKTCAKEVVIDLGDGKQVTRSLPLDKPVEISATFAKSGELKYACSMDMVTGVITVQ